MTRILKSGSNCLKMAFGARKAEPAKRIENYTFKNTFFVRFSL